MSVAELNGPAVACSGDMYDGVPFTIPVAVTLGSSINEAIPKSLSRHRPADGTSTLPGFTSRWTIPASWAAWSTSSNVEPDGGRPRRIQRAIAGDDLREIGCLDQLHDDELALALFDHVVDSHCSGVLEPGRGPCFAEHGTLQPAPVGLVDGRRRQQLLHGDRPLEPQILGPPHHA